MINARFYFVKDGNRQGPFTGVEITKLVACGKLDREMPIHDQEGSLYAAGQVPSETTPLTPPPPPLPAPPVPPQNSANRQSKPPWNPALLGVLGLLFTPLWAGVMTALNARRVGLSRTMDWRWLALGIGWMVADILLTMTPWNFYLTHLAFYATTTGLLWYFAVRPQYEQYTFDSALEFSRPSWTIPVVTGLPPAVLVIFLVVVVPLLPDSPREVCENMLAASDENRSEYLSEELHVHETDINRIVQKIVGDCTLTEGYLLSARDMATLEIDEGCFVNFEMQCLSNTQEATCAGFFHLVSQQKRWKIEEMYFTEIAGEEQEYSFALSQFAKDIREILDPPAPVEDPITDAAENPQIPPRGFHSPYLPPRKQDFEWERDKPQSTKWHVLVWSFLRSKIGKRFLLFLVGLGAGSALLWKRIKSRFRGEDT